LSDNTVVEPMTLAATNEAAGQTPGMAVADTDFPVVKGFSMAPIATTLALALALALALLSLLVKWGSSADDKTLASQPSELLYNIPLLVTLAGALVLSWFDATRRAAVALNLLVGTSWVIGLTDDLLGSITHRSTLGPGAIIATVGAVVALVAMVLGLIATPLRLRIKSDAIIWAGASFVLAGVWVIGDWMSWTSTDYHLNASNYTFPSTGTKDVVTSCCVAFRNQTMPNNVRQALTMALVVVAALTVAFLIPRVAGIALIGIGVLYISDSLSWLYQIAQSHPSPVALGVPVSQVQAGQMTASVSGLPGGWIATTATFGLLALGVFRLLSSSAGHSTLALTQHGPIAANDRRELMTQPMDHSGNAAYPSNAPPPPMAATSPAPHPAYQFAQAMPNPAQAYPMRYCQTCGNPVVHTAVICPRCGSAVSSGGPRTKTTAVLLAVFLSFWTWLYTFKADSAKFWIGLGVGVGAFLLSPFLLGIPLLAPLGIWIWAIVDAASKPELWYQRYPSGLAQ